MPVKEPKPPAGTPAVLPKVSIVLLNYNGRFWLKRCLDSIRRQTWVDHIELIVTDNASTDGSNREAIRRLEGWTNTRFIQHGTNLGYCEGNNRAAKQAKGTWLLFLNNDTWLEPDCLEKLITGAESWGSAAGCPRILNYEDDTFQSLGAFGFDIFGLPSTRGDSTHPRAVLMPEGCAYLVRRDVFEQLGGFDPEWFMYADEWDLSWRLWIAGYEAAAFPEARLHHRGAAQVNAHEGGNTVEFRTSVTKRFYTIRNGLLTLMKNAQNFLLLLLTFQLALLAFEAVVALVVVRRWSFIRRAYLDAVCDCWRLRRHVATERQRIRSFRRRSDLWMLRFLRARPNHLDQLIRVRRQGWPVVSRE